MSSTVPRRADPFKPASRIAGDKKDVWYESSSGQDWNRVRANFSCRSIVNDAAEKSPIQPIVNMGQGF